MGLIQQLIFYPTLGYNMGRYYWNGKRWPWYSRVNDTVILGALPFTSMADELVETERVGGVVCMTEAHEVEHSWALDGDAWQARGVRWQWRPTRDFSGPPDVSDIAAAVNFIGEFDGTDRCVYVHCKAGRTRSALVVACYLMSKYGWYPNVAWEFVRQRRSHVWTDAWGWKRLHEYWKTLPANKDKTLID